EIYSLFGPAGPPRAGPDGATMKDRMSRLLVAALMTRALLLASWAPAAGPPMPPLLAAAEKGDVAEVERLFLQGTDLNQTTTGRRTALHVASAAARDRVIEWLIAHEVNVFAKDEGGRTAADV